MEYILFLNFCMLGRLVYLFADQALNKRQWLTMLLIQCAGLLCFEWDLLQIWCLLLVVLIMLAELVIRPRDNDRHGLRLLSFIFLVVTASFAFGRNGLQLANWVPELGGWLQTQSALVPSLQTAVWQQLNLIVFGLLLTGNEINMAIRMVFHLFHLEPRIQQRDGSDHIVVTTDRDEEEYNAGRVIGILERWLILLVVMVANQLAVVAFVIAAKSFARFRQLEEKSFAEYVLVGTLLSTFLTLLVGLALQNYYAVLG